jgi:hypothetical protein
METDVYPCAQKKVDLPPHNLTLYGVDLTLYGVDLTLYGVGLTLYGVDLTLYGDDPRPHFLRRHPPYPLWWGGAIILAPPTHHRGSLTSTADR